jgi:hypothetical protein
MFKYRVETFIGAHRGRVCVRVFIVMSARMCISICVCTVFKKKKLILKRLLVCINFFDEFYFRD